MKGVLIGFGYWGKILLKEINNEGHFEVVDVIEPNHPGGFDESFGLTFHKKLDPTLWKEYVFFVATPAESHFEICSTLLEAGYHVFCEKPLTTSTETALILFEIAQRNSVSLVVGHSYLHNFSIQAIKQIVSPDIQTKPISFNSVRSAPGPIRRDVSCFWDLAAHDIAIFLDLTNTSSVKVRATGMRVISSVYDSGNICLTTKEKSTAHIFSNWLGAKKHRSIQVSSEHIFVEFDEMDSRNIHILNSEVSQNGGSPVFSTLGVSDLESPVIRELRYFYSIILSESHDLNLDLIPLKVVKVLEGVHESIETGNEVEILL